MEKYGDTEHIQDQSLTYQAAGHHAAYADNRSNGKVNAPCYDDEGHANTHDACYGDMLCDGREVHWMKKVDALIRQHPRKHDNKHKKGYDGPQLHQNISDGFLPTS
jgi:hypothetical protein